MGNSNKSPAIDCRVHYYERNRPERPWGRTLHGPDSPVPMGESLGEIYDWTPQRASR